MPLNINSTRCTHRPTHPPKGCGKSTLMTTLFRIVEPCGGQLLIDGAPMMGRGRREGGGGRGLGLGHQLHALLIAHQTRNQNNHLHSHATLNFTHHHTTNHTNPKGLDTSKIGLTDLRSRLSLVPQDPVIFSGTVRSNVDPFNQAGSDGAIWEALRRAGVDEAVRALGVSLMFWGLGGGHWGVGRDGEGWLTNQGILLPTSNPPLL